MIVERENENTPRDERFETNFWVKFCPKRVKGQKARKTSESADRRRDERSENDFKGKIGASGR